MSSSDPSPARQPTAVSAQAAVIDPSDSDAPPYAMFEVGRLSVAGAFLLGTVFFERGEEFLVQLARDATRTLRVRARVVDHTRTPAAGMTIEFIDLTDAELSALSELSASISA